MDNNLAEELEYLEEVLIEYERFVQNIGNNGLAANLLLYYRDEVQESLKILEGKVELTMYWKKVVELDNILKAKAKIFVEEVGRENFRQCRIALDPPKLNWWWYLDKTVSPPVQKPKQKVKRWIDWLKE